MKKRLVITTMLVFGITIFMGCIKDEPVFSKLSLEQKIALNNEDVKIHNFAQIFAKSLSNESGRSFIKKEALKEFDGDFDILFVEAKDKNLSEIPLKNSNHTTFGSFLKEYISVSNNLKSDEDFNEFLYSLLEEYPLLQISMPELSEGSTINWDESTFIPLVAVLPLNFDEKTSEIITAYDMNGNIFYLDAKNPPENPVIVISQNERLIAIKKGENLKNAEMMDDSCLEPYYETELYSYYIPIDCGDDPFEDLIFIDNDIIPSPFDRDVNNNRDQLNKAEFVSIDAYRAVEVWPEGRPEFKVVISYIEKVGTTYQAKSIIKILTKTDWVNRYIFWSTLDTKQIDLPIITFDKELIGNSIKYTWIEQDNSDTKTELLITVSSKFGEDADLTTVNTSLKVSVSAADDEAGEDVVEYKDGTKGEGTVYNTGIVKFWVNQL